MNATDEQHWEIVYNPAPLYFPWQAHLTGTEIHLFASTARSLRRRIRQYHRRVRKAARLAEQYRTVHPEARERVVIASRIVTPNARKEEPWQR